MNSQWNRLRRFGLCAPVLALCLAIPVDVRGQESAKEQQITKAQADAILNELKAIRQLLEQMVKPNPAPAPSNPSSPRVRAIPRPAPPGTVNVNGARGYWLGQREAPVTLIEYTDYQCPFCQRFHETVFQELRKNYIDTGQVRFVSRDLPLEMHSNALPAARAARCAGEQGKFWEMRHALLSNTRNVGPEFFRTYARGLSLDMTAFEACLTENEKNGKDIQQDMIEAGSAGITGTPSFVLGKSSGDDFVGILIVGAQPFATFEQRIKELLAPTERAQELQPEQKSKQ